MANFYINAETFNLATSIYSDIALSTLAPDGFYSFENYYRQQLNGFLINPSTTCDTPIIANNNTYSTMVTLGMNGNNILTNDTLGPDVATTNNVTITQISTTNPNVTINTTTGSVIVNQNTPVGNYTIVYKICEKTKPTNCDTANIYVTVTPLTNTFCYNFGTDCTTACSI